MNLIAMKRTVLWNPQLQPIPQLLPVRYQGNHCQAGSPFDPGSSRRLVDSVEC